MDERNEFRLWVFLLFLALTFTVYIQANESNMQDMSDRIEMIEKQCAAIQ
jgi:hypothetical protein